MELTEDEIYEKYGKHCGHCNRNTSLAYEYEFTCFSCGFNVTKQKHELSKIQREKMNFIKKIKNQGTKNILHLHRKYLLYEGNAYNQIYEVLSFLKNKKMKINNI